MQHVDRLVVGCHNTLLKADHLDEARIHNKMSAEVFAPTQLETVDDKNPNSIIDLLVTILRNISESNPVWNFDQFSQSSIPRLHT